MSTILRFADASKNLFLKNREDKREFISNQKFTTFHAKIGKSFKNKDRNTNKQASVESDGKSCNTANVIEKEVKMAADVWISIGLPGDLKFRHEYA